MNKKRRKSNREKIRLFSTTVIVLFVVLICDALVIRASTGEIASQKESCPPMVAEDTYTEKETDEVNIVTLDLVYVYPTENSDEGDDEYSELTEQANKTEEPSDPQYDKLYTERDVVAMVQMAYGEGWITQSDTEMSWMMWCVCNRFDSEDPYYKNCNSLYDIITQEGQFLGYNPNHPIEDRLLNLARDVLDRWSAEKQGATDVGRTLPREYMHFWGDGSHNYFTDKWQGGNQYDGYLGSPYDN